MDTQNQDELIIKQQEEIQKDIAAKSCLVTEPMSWSNLEKEFEKFKYCQNEMKEILKTKLISTQFVEDNIIFVVNSKFLALYK